MEQLGRLLIITGVILAVVGIIFVLGPRLPFRLGRLPLDFHYQRDNFSFYFPLGTSILISIVLTLVFALLSRGR
jgi:membrane associated rhomboid family serine protease